MSGRVRSVSDLDELAPYSPSRPTGRMTTTGSATGPYDSEDPVADRTEPGSGRVDFGSLRIAIPERAQLQVEKGNKDLLRAVHVLVPSGRVSLSALAAPRSNPLWRELAREIGESLAGDGADVRTEWGEWGREVRAGSGGALSRFIGIDGPRWMLYGVATGPEDGADELAEVLREMIRTAVVHRGTEPLPVKTVLPLRLPEHLEDSVEQAREVAARKPRKAGAKRNGAARKPGRGGPARTSEAGRPASAPAREASAPGRAPMAPRRPMGQPSGPHTAPGAAQPSGPHTTPGLAPAAGPHTAPGLAPAAGPHATPGLAPAAASMPPYEAPPATPRTPSRPMAVPPPAPGLAPVAAASPQAVPHSVPPPAPVDDHGAQPAIAQLPPAPPAYRSIGSPGSGGRPAAAGRPHDAPARPASFGPSPTGPSSIGPIGLPPVSGYPGGNPVEATWSTSQPVVSADEVAQQPAWALLSEAPSFWPDERFRPEPPGARAPRSRPLDHGSTDGRGPGYGAPEPSAAGTPDTWAAGPGRAEPRLPESRSPQAWPADGWSPGSPEPDPGEREPGRYDHRPPADPWSGKDAVLTGTDALHAVLTGDAAATRDWAARADRRGRHRRPHTD